MTYVFCRSVTCSSCLDELDETHSAHMKRKYTICLGPNIESCHLESCHYTGKQYEQQFVSKITSNARFQYYTTPFLCKIIISLRTQVCILFPFFHHPISPYIYRPSHVGIGMLFLSFTYFLYYSSTSIFFKRSQLGSSLQTGHPFSIKVRP